MKKILFAVCSMLLSVCILGGMTAYAEAAPADGIFEIGDAPEDTAIPDSYTLVDDGDVVLSVTHVEAPGLTAALSDVTTNGYYTAEFMIPETNDLVFLTGLTQDNVAEIRGAIIDRYSGGADFDLKNLGFLDTEKSTDDEDDDDLCWAASSSNILTYTGWAAQAGFTGTDDLFETFISNFEDAGGSPYYGFGWFFNGVRGASGAAMPKDGSGAYLTDYFYAEYADILELDTTGTENLNVLYDRLHNGCGAALSVEIYEGSEDQGGHAISLWGFVTDIRYPRTQKAHYKSVIVTDSDSDKIYVRNGMDRRDADDVMHVFALDPVQQGSIDTYSFAITRDQTAVIRDAVTLASYSASLPKETDASASRNIFTTPDVTVDPFYLTDDISTEDLQHRTVTTFAPGKTIYMQPCFQNCTDINYVGSIRVRFTVKDADGSVLYTRTAAASSTILPNEYLAFNPIAIPKQFSVGDYTVTAEFNPTRDTAEAYYYNDTKTIRFKVRDSYLIGDTDNDGSVGSIDATLIRRFAALMDVDFDENAPQRADVNGNGEIDILDATILQRYLAAETTFYTVDEERFYD